MDIFDWMSIAAFAMTTITWLYGWWNSKERVEMRVTHYIPFPTAHAFYVTIENRSKSPLLISKIILFNEISQTYIESYVFSKEVFRVGSRSGEEVLESERRHTIPLPISLPGHSGLSGYLEFPDDQQTLSELSIAANFQLHTSRDRSFEFVLKPEKTLQSAQLTRPDIP